MQGSRDLVIASTELIEDIIEDLVIASTGNLSLDPIIRSQPDGQVPILSTSYIAPRVLHRILRHGPGCDSRAPAHTRLRTADFE